MTGLSSYDQNACSSADIAQETWCLKEYEHLTIHERHPVAEMQKKKGMHHTKSLWSSSGRRKISKMCLDKAMIHNLCNTLQLLLLGEDGVQPAWLLPSRPFLLFVLDTASSSKKAWRKNHQEWIQRSGAALMPNICAVQHILATSQEI